MEIVEVSCPRSIDLKNIVKNVEKNTKSIFQTVDIYDKVIISQNKKQSGIYIQLPESMDENIKNDIKKIIEIFSNYINKKIDNIIISIEKNKTDLLENKYNILAGILIGLNIYYNSLLQNHELVYLAQQIDNLISYYLVCGYRKIDINNKNLEIGENKYRKYLFFFGMDDKERVNLKEYIINNNISYSDNNELYFIAIKDIDALRVPFTIKKEFKNVKFYECSNTNKNKVLKKYLNDFN